VLAKAEVRAEILAARRAVSRQTRATEAGLLATHLAAVVHPGQAVCAYVPVGSEPGSMELIDALVRREVTVLLPVAREDPDGTPARLLWGRYVPGELVRASFGLREPAPPWLPPESVAAAEVIVVPALAVDRSGVRLGRGAGFYDRTLPSADPAAMRIAVVRDDELVDHLPCEPHDVRMTHAVTPHRGVLALEP
jgi:5-formyltetrahydrofolate cyclo-ligase